MTKFSKSERKNIKQLQIRHDFQSFTFAFDELFFYIDLWPALQIEIFHKIINFKCSKIKFTLNIHIIVNIMKKLRNYFFHVRCQ